jgi:hypothetical protein
MRHGNGFTLVTGLHEDEKGREIVWTWCRWSFLDHCHFQPCVHGYTSMALQRPHCPAIVRPAQSSVASTSIFARRLSAVAIWGLPSVNDVCFLQRSATDHAAKNRGSGTYLWRDDGLVILAQGPGNVDVGNGFEFLLVLFEGLGFLELCSDLFGRVQGCVVEGCLVRSHCPLRALVCLVWMCARIRSVRWRAVEYFG